MHDPRREKWKYIAQLRKNKSIIFLEKKETLFSRKKTFFSRRKISKFSSFDKTWKNKLSLLYPNKFNRL